MNADKVSVVVQTEINDFLNQILSWVQLRGTNQGIKVVRCLYNVFINKHVKPPLWVSKDLLTL